MELKKASNHPFLFHNAEEKWHETKGHPDPDTRSRDDMLRGLIMNSGKMVISFDRLANCRFLLINCSSG